MKTITITITTPEGASIYQAEAERWTDFVILRRIGGQPLSGLDETMLEQLSWHSFRARVYAEDSGYKYAEESEGIYVGGESR